MRLIAQNGITVFQFPALNALAGIQHGVFLREVRNHGRTTDLDLGLRCGASDSAVWENRRRVRSFFGTGTMVFARQVHGARIAVWDDKQIDTHPPAGDFVYLDGDALVTNVKDQLLFIQVADCQSVIIVDPERKVVANIHSGWRGSIQNIVGRTVGLMVQRFDCRAEDLLCAIGPSLGPCCAEFIHYREEIPPQYWDYGDRRHYFDFWRMTADQLTASGVQAKNISSSNICTRCNAHLFFSYRAARNTGRFAAVVTLRSEQRERDDSTKG